jgi:glycosyltransferase involved in cell wall biosynthesis
MKAKASNKICHCSILHKLDDSRIFYKECISLAKVGYNVTFIARPSTNKQFDESSYQGVSLQKITGKNRLYNNFYLFMEILKQRMKVVHFHDPELIVMGFFLKLLGKKVIYDVHENVRQDILHKTWVRPALRALLSKAAVFLELIASVFFNGIVSATPTIAKNFTNKNTYVIRNLPPLKHNETLTETKRDKNIIIYIGTLSEARGIKELIAAAGHLTGVAELWLLGGWNDEAFRLECEKMEGFKNTNYLGMVNHEEVTKILSEASIGLCTLHPIDTFKDSYPIKVFEYMQNGLPVLMSNFEMWQELFGDLCEYADPMNPLQLADQIKSMLASPSRLEEMSAKGKVVIHEQFNWDSESRSLEELYSKI